MDLTWDHDNAEWDEYPRNGTVVVHGYCGNVIRDECLTLDSWLVALARGLLTLRNGMKSCTDRYM